MIRATHYTAALLLFAAFAVHASAPIPGTSDSEVARFLAPDVIADDRSALKCGDIPCRFIGQPGANFAVARANGGSIPHVPLPPSILLMCGAPGALWVLKRRK